MLRETPAHFKWLQIKKKLKKLSFKFAEHKGNLRAIKLSIETAIYQSTCSHAITADIYFYAISFCDLKRQTIFLLDIFVCLSLYIVS
jgi:hypothetical protein